MGTNMNIHLIITLSISICITSCSDSSDYVMPPEYDYDTPTSKPLSAEIDTENSMLSIVLSMRETTVDIPDSITTQETENQIIVIQNESNTMTSVAKTSQIAVSHEKNIDQPSSQISSPPITDNTEFKELDFSSSIIGKQKITTIKLNIDELTYSSQKSSSPYFISEKNRYKKMGKNGQIIDDKSNGWFCVKDLKNNVTWEAKTAGKKRHYQHTFSINGGGGYCGQTLCTTEAYINYINQSKLCGRSNWRLPNRIELRSLSLDQRIDDIAFIDTHYFPNTQAHYYWSASNFKYAESRAWAVDFSNGFDNSREKNRAYHIRLVSNN